MRRTIQLLYSEDDRAALEPILDRLREKGVRAGPEDGGPGRDKIVLTVLTESFYADPVLMDRLLGLVGAGAENVLPLQLDGAPVPDTLKNALYSRNIIPAAGREPAQIAERIEAALPRRKSRLPLILTAGAVVLAAAAGLLIWRFSQKRESVPVMADAPISVSVPAGLTAADLEQIKYVYFVGDRFYHYTEEELLEHFEYPATYHMEEDGMHWYSTEDGHRLSLTAYSPESLEFLTLMPNLEGLDLILTDVERLPDLSGLTSLSWVEMADCTTRDLSGLAGSSLEYFHIFRCPIEDYSVLTGCEKLTEVRMEFDFTPEADLSGFAPPALRDARFEHGRDLPEMDLSGLADCPQLRTLRIGNLPVADLSFLAGTPALETLELEALDSLRDISPAGGLSSLRELSVSSCPHITDFTPIAGCTALESVRFETENGGEVFRDASWMSDLPKLKSISLENVDLPDLEFLRKIGARQSIVDFSYYGRIADYSGLAGVRSFGSLSLDPVGTTPLEQILPYLQGATVQNLAVHNFRTVDLSALPQATRSLELDRCGVTDLSSIPENWNCPSRIILDSCASLRSLEGLEKTYRSWQQEYGVLAVRSCPRLTDWDALSGMILSELRITGGFSLPSFGEFRATTICLDSVEGVNDLEFFREMDPSRSCSIELPGMDGITSLAPLSGLRGAYLAVPPQLAEQAEDLVEAGRFSEYRIVYPQGGWDPNDAEIFLMDLEELETLPKSMLRRVERLCLAGDTLADLGAGDVREEWAGAETPVLLFCDRDTGETTPIEYGEGPVTDVGVFSGLSGLRELRLFAQPLESLDGIQSLAALEDLTAAYCPALTDVSAAFACQQLRRLNLCGCPVGSIQGAQNLQALAELDISRTRVTDLTPLLGLEALECVRLSSDMGEAIQSLEGQSYHFKIETEG